MFCFNKLFVIIFLIFNSSLFSQLRIYNGNLAFASQFDLDTFQNKYDVINGTLRIGSTSSSNPSDITDLSKLLGLKAVWGDVGIENNGKLKNLHGLDSIIVAGYFAFHINRNDSLENVDALNNWKMWSSNTPSLDRTIDINVNKNLVSLGFNSLDTIGTVYISKNAKLRYINGFNTTRRVDLYLLSQTVDSFGGFAKCRTMANYFSYSNIKSFEGFNKVYSMGMTLTNCTMDSMVGSKNVYAWIDVQDCPNLQHIDFGRSLPPTSKDFTYTTYSLIKNCPKLKTVVNPIQFAPSLYSIIEKCGVENVSFDLATYLDAGFKDCPDLNNINIPNADTLSFLTLRNKKLINILFPKATLVDGAFSLNSLKRISFPNATRVNQRLTVIEDSLELITLPNLVDAVADTYKGRNYGTGFLSIQSLSTDSVKSPYKSKIYTPKLEWSSIEFYTNDNSIHDLSKLKECNFLTIGTGNDSVVGGFIINPDIRFNQLADSIYKVKNLLYNNDKSLLLSGNIKDNIPLLHNLNDLNMLSIGSNKTYFSNIFLPKLDNLNVLDIYENNGQFINLNFIPQINKLNGDRVIKFLGIGKNKSLSLCNTLCEVIKNYDGTYSDGKPRPYYIRNNAPGCNSASEIIASCNGVNTTDPQYNNINYIQVYPNPANSGSIINIPIDFSGNNFPVQYEIYSLTGVRMHSYLQDHYTHTFTMPQLSAGMYLLHVTQGNSSYIGKIIIE